MLPSEDDELPGALQLFALAEEHNQLAKSAEDEAERDWCYEQKCDMLVALALLHGEDLMVSRDRGLISFSIVGPQRKRHRLHVPRRVLAEHIKGNGYSPIIRGALRKLFGIKQEKRPRSRDNETRRCWQKRPT